MTINAGCAQWSLNNVIASITLVENLLVISYSSHVRTVVVHAHMAHKHDFPMFNIPRKWTVNLGALRCADVPLAKVTEGDI